MVFKEVLKELYVETTNDLPLNNILVSTHNQQNMKNF